MAVFREVRTEVYCDICGEYLLGWKSNKKYNGVSVDWAKHYARQEGCTTGKRIVCKKCRIEKRIQKCSLAKKMGGAEIDTQTGKCLGFAGADGDEPIEKCKKCIANTTHDWEEYARKRSF